MDNELLYYIWLNLNCKPDSSTFVDLLRAFKTPKGIFDASDRKIEKVLSSRNSDRERILLRDLDAAKSVLEFCEQKQVGILTYGDEKYPNALREIAHPPVLLYYRGVLPDFNKGCYISIVGTRSMSDYGKKNAFRVGRDLAKAGATIVSGMALGIDAVATAGALHAEKPTVAVLGCGINICYPKEHLTLARQIVKNGCILTEYPPSFSPSRYTFPQRNRIISGLSQATVVVEGSEKSGALITARCAKEQGRIVYALPGNVDNKNSEGPMLLIRNGARAFTSADDIIRDLEAQNMGVLNPFVLTPNEKYPVNEVLDSLSISYIKIGRHRAYDPEAPLASDACPPAIHEDPSYNQPSAQAPSAQATQQTATLQELAAEQTIGVDKDCIRLYQRIPINGDISIDELVDEYFTDARIIMKCILKLEMAKLVKILPGERVSRNTH